MSSILVINATGVETRVALIENGTISEFYLERKREKGIVGNIYLGRVVRVLPGMQAAFVDIGLDKAAFLYVSDVFYDPDFSDQVFDLADGEHAYVADVPPSENGDTSGPIAVPTPGEIAAAEAALEATPVPGAGEAPPPSPQLEVTSSKGAAPAPEPPAPVAGPTPLPEPVPTPPAPPPPAVPDSAPPLLATEKAASEAAPSAPSAAPTEGQPAPTAASGGEPTGTKSKSEGGREERGERRFRGRGRHRRWGRDRREERGGRHGDEAPPRPKRNARIEDLLKVGQEVLVQVAKDPIGTKGARLTSHISLPGRQIVFMPTVDHVGISRRIASDRERRRLREIVDRLRPAGTGFIVRTVADGVSEEKLVADIRFLLAIWNEIGKKKEKANGRPSLLHPDLDLILRSTRDLFAQDVEKLVIDDRVEHERVSQFVREQDPQLVSRVELHSGPEPVFDAYGIEHEINRSLQRKVWLKSGGYLIIDQAEALVAIDVNSGRYVGKKNLEETITRINIEAAQEIVYQLRLRNIGGIIIIDFIDMDRAENRDKVFHALHEALGRDRAKTNVLKISELGLVEMTRKRVRESVTRMLHEACKYCEGRGHVKSARTVAYEIFRLLRRDAGVYREPAIVVNCHPEVAAVLTGEERDELRSLMDRTNKSIHVRSQAAYHQEQYDVYGKSQKDTRPERGVASGESAAVVDKTGG